MSRAIALAVLAGALLIGQQVVAKAARDTLFLSNFGAAALPTAMIVAAAISLPGVLGGSALMARYGPRRFLPACLSLNGLAFVAEWAALSHAPGAVAAFFYVHVALFGGFSISAFWSVVNERFDPHAARRAFSWIALGSAVGGLLGGLLAQRVSAWFGVHAMLLVLAPTNLLAAWAISLVHGAAAPREVAAATPPGLAVIGRSSYLRKLALLVAMVATSAATLEYAFKADAAATLVTPARLAGFFATYYAAVSVATVLLQGTLASYTLAQFGLGTTLSVLPAVILAGGALCLSIEGPWSVILLRGAEGALANSMFRSGYEPLYTPLPSQAKRASKPIIDVAADRSGEALGSGAILLALGLFPAQIRWIALGIAMLCSSVSLWLSSRLQRGYVAELASSLRQGMVRLSLDDVSDATTRLTLSRTHAEMDREAILRQVEALRRGHVAAPELASQAADLLSADPQRIVSALTATALDVRLVSLVIPLLEYDDIRSAVTSALEPVAARTIGQLSDRLLDSTLPLNTRQRIARLLAKVSDLRAVRALTDGLSTPILELREGCARALLALHRTDPALRPPEELVLSVVRAELELDASDWRVQVTGIDSLGNALPAIKGVRDSRILEHVFTLLALTQDVDSLELSLRALGSSDQQLSGTALEYLENVIPSEIRARLWPHLGDYRPAARGAPRSRLELAAELRRSLS